MRKTMNGVRKARKPSRSGFTLTELLVTISIGSMVSVVVLNTFLWCGQQAVLCVKSGWSQREALVTAEKVSQYIRNASEIVAIDESEGMWVTLRHSDGSEGTLVYSNAVPLLRDGQMFLSRDDGSDQIVARGLTEIQNSNGFTQPVFHRSSPRVVRVAYRVSEPVESGGRDANDGAFAAFVRFSACLRNTAE